MSQRAALTFRNFIDHPGGHALEEVVWEAGPVGGHSVVARDRADDDDVAVAALVALHPDAAQIRREHAEGLPPLAIEPGGADLVLEHVGGVAEDGEPLARHLPAD